MKKYHAVLFDLDGTLVDSQRGILFCFEKTFSHFGITLNENQLRRYLGPPLRESFAEHLPAEQVEEAVTLYRDWYDQYGIAMSSPFEGAREMLNTLKEHQIITAVATSKTRTVAQKVLDYFDLSRYFDVIQGASEDRTLDTKTAVMQAVLADDALKGCTAVMVGDREHDLTGAKNCGIDVVGCTYGYAQPGELEEGETVYLAKSPEDLTSWLLDFCFGKGEMER